MQVFWRFFGQIPDAVRAIHDREAVVGNDDLCRRPGSTNRRAIANIIAEFCRCNRSLPDRDSPSGMAGMTAGSGGIPSHLGNQYGSMFHGIQQDSPLPASVEKWGGFAELAGLPQIPTRIFLEF